MSRKTAITDSFQAFKKAHAAAKEKIKQINSNPAYSPEGKAEQVAKVRADFAAEAETYRNAAIAAIDAGSQELQTKWSKGTAARLLDSGYQAGLANTIKAFEGGTVTRQEDAAAIVEAYKGDYVALAALRNAFLANSNETVRGFSGLIPADNRDKNGQMLKQIRDNAARYMTEKSLNDGVSKPWNRFNTPDIDISVSMDDMTAYLNDNFSDDLEMNS